MRIQIFNAMNEGMYLSLIVIEVIVLITVLIAIAGFVIYLAGIAWLCLDEKRRSMISPRTYLTRE